MPSFLRVKKIYVVLVVLAFQSVGLAQTQLGSDAAALTAPQPAPTKPMIMFCSCVEDRQIEKYSAEILEMVVRDGQGQIQQIKMGPYYGSGCHEAIEHNPACPQRPY